MFANGNISYGSICKWKYLQIEIFANGNICKGSIYKWKYLHMEMKSFCH